jgi:type I restriction enzyme S subunit
MKYEYIHSGIDWIGEVPKHWRKEKIFRAAELITSGGTPRSGNDEYYEGDIYWIQSGDLNDSYVIETEKKITQEGLDNSSAKLFPAGTLLVAMYGATIGKLGIQTMEAATNQACCGIYPTTRIDLKFLFYFFHAVKDKYLSDSYGGGQPNISQSVIKQTYFFVPEKSEQLAISTYLDKTCAYLDRVLEIKRKQIENLQQQFKSIVQHTVTKGLKSSVQLTDSGEDWIGKMPELWKQDRLKDLVELRNEKTDEKSEVEDYLELEDIEKENGRILGFRNTEEVNSKVTIFKKGDVLFGKLRPYLNKHYLAKEDGKCTGEILAFNCSKILNRYFEYCLSSHGFIETCTIISYGAKMPRVDFTTQLAYFYLPLPPAEEQVEICNTLDIIRDRNLETISKIEKQIEVLLTYKKSLIHEVVTGKKQVYGLTKEKQQMQTA